MLLVSASVMAAALIFLGVCAYSHHHQLLLLRSAHCRHCMLHAADTLQILTLCCCRDCDWLPITCVVSYTMAANMGLGSLPTIFLSEFYPVQYRCVWAGLTLATQHAALLALTSLAPALEAATHNYSLFWFFSGVCVLVIVFSLHYVPETRGRDTATIEAKFARLGKVARASPWVTPCPSPSASSVRRLHFKSQLFTQ